LHLQSKEESVIRVNPVDVYKMPIRPRCNDKVKLKEDIEMRVAAAVIGNVIMNNDEINGWPVKLCYATLYFHRK